MLQEVSTKKVMIILIIGLLVITPVVLTIYLSMQNNKAVCHEYLNSNYTIIPVNELGNKLPIYIVKEQNFYKYDLDYLCKLKNDN